MNFGLLLSLPVFHKAWLGHKKFPKKVFFTIAKSGGDGGTRPSVPAANTTLLNCFFCPSVGGLEESKNYYLFLIKGFRVGRLESLHVALGDDDHDNDGQLQPAELTHAIGQVR